jgi:hypothetical protein
MFMVVLHVLCKKASRAHFDKQQFAETAASGTALLSIVRQPRLELLHGFADRLVPQAYIDRQDARVSWFHV